MPGANGARLSVCLLWLVACASSHGQIQASSEADSVVRSWAVMFNIGNDLTIEPFHGAGVAVQHHFSPLFAIRVEVSGGYEISRTDVGGFFSSDNLKVGYYLLSTQLLAYSRARDKLAIFYGMGPIIGYDWHQEQGTAGIRSVLGAEWFARSYLSFHAEYGIDIRYVWKEPDTILFPSHPYYFDSRQYAWSVSTTATKVGVSVHF